MTPTESSIPGLAVRGYRSRGLPQVDLFWTGSRADAFDVYRDRRRIATVAASGYTDRFGRDGSGSYRYRVGVTGTLARSNEAVVTFGAGSRGARSDATTARAYSSATPVSVPAAFDGEPFRHRAGGQPHVHPRDTMAVISAVHRHARRMSARAARPSRDHAAQGALRHALWRVLALAAWALLAAALPATAIADSAGTSPSYILIAADERLPSGLGQRLAAIGGSITAAVPEIGVVAVRSRDPRFAARAAALPGVRSVVPDARLALEPPAAAAAPVGTLPASVDDDELFDLQWGLDAIEAPEAWALGARGAGVRVAVLDSGADLDHPDLAANLNLELARSFIPGQSVEAPPGPGGLGPHLHHGTWVAGIIAAADNGVGTIGVAPQAEIVPIRVCQDPSGLCPSSALIAGLVHAAAIDADVINLSLGGLIPRRGYLDEQAQWASASEVAELLVAERRALGFAYRSGAAIVAAAGNAGQDLDGNDDVLAAVLQLGHTIGVSATGPLRWGLDQTTDVDRPASYSNYGQSAIDLAAPGGDFDPELLGRDCTVALMTAPCFVFDLVFGPTADGWTAAAGTSAAAPHVAGVAALVIGAHAGDMQPAAVEAILRAAADDLGNPGRDDFYGHGRVNAGKAVAEPAPGRGPSAPPQIHHDPVPPEVER